MGWNYGWTMMEETIVGMYDLFLERNMLNRFDKGVVLTLIKPYISTDADEGGAIYLKSNDGKSMEQIVVKAMEPDFKTSSIPRDPYAYENEEEGIYYDHENYAYTERFYKLWRDSSVWK